MIERRVLGIMPVLSYHFGLSPADVWALTDRELESYVKALDRLQREELG